MGVLTYTSSFFLRMLQELSAGWSSVTIWTVCIMQSESSLESSELDLVGFLVGDLVGFLVGDFVGAFCGVGFGFLLTLKISSSVVKAPSNRSKTSSSLESSMR